MRLRAIFTAGAALSLAACAALSGLDQITESACAPDCTDASDPAPEAAADAPLSEASLPALVEASPDVPSPQADTDTGTGTDPDAGTDADADAQAAAEAAPDADAGTCGTVYLSENFDSPAPTWTLDPTWSIATTCANPPAPQKGNPDPTVDHTTGTPGGIVGAYVCGNNPAGQTTPFAYATSPAIDVSAAPSLILSFYRWLNTDSAGWMTSTVDVFDGSSWVNVYSNATGSSGIVTDSAWTRITYDVTAHKNAAFRVRFGYAVVDAGVYAMSCWNVDDVMLSSAACP